MPMLRDGEQMVDMLRTNFSISAAAKYSQNSIISFDSSMPNLYYYIRMGKLNLHNPILNAQEHGKFFIHSVYNEII